MREAARPASTWAELILEAAPVLFQGEFFFKIILLLQSSKTNLARAFEKRHRLSFMKARLIICLRSIILP
jgi:hypothetical protein